MAETTPATKSCSSCRRETRSTSRGMCANCYRIWQQENFPPNATCEVCGAAFFRRSSTSSKGRTCGRPCFMKWKQGRNQHNKPTDGAELIARECEWCSIAFTVEKRQVDKGLGRFCSIECSAIRRRNDPTRSLHPENAWRQREGFRKLSDELLSDPKVRCTSCGAPRTKGNLVVHHPIPPNGNRDLLMDPSNMVVLCRACHFRVHHHESVEVDA